MSKELPKDLYTAKDVKETRVYLEAKQGGIDPILGVKFLEPTALDHSHKTQLVRAALGRNTNAFEGIVANGYKRCLEWLTDVPLPVILRNLADYLEADYSCNPYHNAWLKRVQIDFNKLREGEKDAVLELLGQPKGVNAVARKKLFNQAILSREFGYEKVRDILEGINNA